MQTLKLTLTTVAISSIVALAACGKGRPPAWAEVIRIETTDEEFRTLDVEVWPLKDPPPRPRPADEPLEFHPAG